MTALEYSSSHGILRLNTHSHAAKFIRRHMQQCDILGGPSRRVNWNDKLCHSACWCYYCIKRNLKSYCNPCRANINRFYSCPIFAVRPQRSGLWHVSFSWFALNILCCGKHKWRNGDDSYGFLVQYASLISMDISLLTSIESLKSAFFYGLLRSSKWVLVYIAFIVLLSPCVSFFHSVFSLRESQGQVLQRNYTPLGHPCSARRNGD